MHQLSRHHSVQISRSASSLELRARCCAMAVSQRLLLVPRVWFTGQFHFSSQLEVPCVVFQVERDEFWSPTPSHQLAQMRPHLHSVSTVCRIMQFPSDPRWTSRSSLQTAVPAHHRMLCARTSLPHKDRNTQFSSEPRHGPAPPSGRQNTTGSWITSSLSILFQAGVQMPCAPSSCVQIHLHPLPRFRSAHTSKILAIDTSEFLCSISLL